MGIENRDYIRDHRPRGFVGGPSSGFSAIKFLLIANGVVFLLQNIPQLAVTEWLSLSLRDISSFQIQRLVTYGFCHGNLMHILFNMYVLWMFGRAVEPIYNSREFLAFFLTGVVTSGVVHLAIESAQDGHSLVIGASGGVMAVVFLTAMHYPRMTVLLFFVFPIQLRWLAVMYAVADVMGMAEGTSNVAHAAHLGGAAFGMAYHHYHWRIMPYVDGLLRLSQWRPWRARPRVKIYRPAAPQRDAKEIERQVNTLLDKIRDHGEASLTDKEREILTEASKWYKNRT